MRLYSSQVSDDDPFLLDEAETARCVELCRAHLIEGAPAHVAEELAHAWIAVVGETLLHSQKGPPTCDVHMLHWVLNTKLDEIEAGGGHADGRDILMVT